MTEIVVIYWSIDRFRKRSKFKTLKGAQAFAQKWVGKHPTFGHNYAVSDDGIGKIEVGRNSDYEYGCTLADLFPST